MSLIKPQPNTILGNNFGSSLVHCTQFRKETSFCAYQTGSFTVEAAIVLPLTMGFLLVFLFYFRVLSVQAAIEDALIYAGRVTAVESILTEEETVLYLSAEAIFKEKLCENKEIERYVMGGVMGVSLLGSNFLENSIVLKANCMISFPIRFFGFEGIWLSCVNHFTKWNGDTYKNNAQEMWVYITETGTVYHKDTSCRSLDLNIQQGLLTEVTIYRGASGQKYYACSRCLESMESLEVVYFTDYGHLYHGKLSCSALKRTISKVSLSQIEDRQPCSFCY